MPRPLPRNPCIRRSDPVATIFHLAQIARHHFTLHPGAAVRYRHLMKTISLSIAAACLLGIGYLVAQASDNPSAPPPDASAPGSNIPAFIGRDVKVYFRQAEKIRIEEIPNASLGYLSGSVTRADAQLLTLRMSSGDTCWIPLSSIAYIRADNTPATQPAAMPE